MSFGVSIFTPAIDAMMYVCALGEYNYYKNFVKKGNAVGDFIDIRQQSM